MKSSLVFRLLFLAVSMVLGAAVVRAENLGAVRARMEQRQGAVDSLKDRKLVGENNRGYLEARSNLTPGDQKTVSDENADRRTVYEALAAQTGASADDVGRQRAEQIASRSKRGVWIQAQDGSWSEKG
ncbi:MAG TPA: YdbL family protein [Opitutaceae bacterium]|nr:YdbL family protein [Opitutaceae bacterium]